MTSKADRPLYQSGRVVLKVRTQPDGSLLMYKPFLLKEEHIMKMTGAPGWDKKLVDSVFTDGVPGILRYQYDTVQYDLPIEQFREHAFERAGTYGEQYHVHQKYYRASGLRTVSPKRGSSAGYKPPEAGLPKKITFGEWIPCTKCGTTGKAGREGCGKCQGRGFVKSSSSATSSS